MKNKENFFQKFAASMTIENIRERVQWLVILRWIAGVSVVIAVLVGKAFFADHVESYIIPLCLGVFILFYNSLFQLITKYFTTHPDSSSADVKRRMALINLQILIDLTVLAALIYFTGGITNPFLSFFIFHMVISSILLSKLNAYVWAVFTISLESLLFYLEHFGYIPCQKFLPGYPPGLVSNGTHVMFILVSFSVTLIITVYFATSIMRPIRKRQMELSELQNMLENKRDLLEAKNKELSDVDHSKTKFLYRVEHELKAPIGALQSLISVVRRGYDSVDEEKKKELLSRAENRICVMKELVTDLLSLSRVTERRFQLEIQEIDFQRTVEEVIEDLAGYSAKKEINVKLKCASNLPILHADKQAIIEIVHNLIHNGLKYSFEGSVNVRVAEKDGNIVFQVEDSGIGISEEHLENIFTEFYRASNAKAFEEGSGLGLSLVKHLVLQHSGEIDVKSRLNEGTTFTVTLPAQAVSKKEKSL